MTSRWNAGWLVVAVAVAHAAPVCAEEPDLFARAGHALAEERWVNLRRLPAIDVALAADDAVLVESIDHPATSVALEIDGVAVAGDCVVTDQKPTTYATADPDGNTATRASTVSTSFLARCGFAEGTSGKALQAKSIAIQLALTNGTLEPRTLTRKQRKRFQTLR